MNTPKSEMDGMAKALGFLLERGPGPTESLTNQYALDCQYFVDTYGPTLAALVADGERYRWIASHAVRINALVNADDHEEWDWSSKLGEIVHDPELDTAIDAARAGGG